MDMIESQKVLQSPHSVHLKAWYCFVDDIFVLWTGSEIELDEFTTFWNELLEFSVTKSQKEICFLDVWVNK